MADPFDEQAPAATASASESGSAGIPESDAMPNPESDDLPHLPSTHVAADRDEMAQQRAVVPGQEMREITEKRVVAIVAAAAVAILVSTAAWGYWLATTGDQRRAFTVRVGQPHQLIMENDLRGRYVTNQDSGKRLFVVNGVIENAFEGQQVRWIRIKGTAYADPGQSRALGTAYAYAGNQLEDDQLAQWKLPDIKAYYGFTNGRKELNLSIPSGAKVPYQLVFSDVNDEVGRTVAQIVSYHRDGRAVFIDNP